MPGRPATQDLCIAGMPERVLAYENHWQKAPDLSVTVCDDWRFEEYYRISGE